MNALISATKKDHKLVFLPDELVESLVEAANKKAVSLSTYASEGLEQVLKSEELGIPLDEIVESYRLLRVQLASGAVQIPRRRLNALAGELLGNDREGALARWEEAGRWQGEFLTTLFGEDAVNALEGVLRISWNLDDVSVKGDEMEAEVMFASFALSLESTELLLTYITGIMKAFGYEKGDERSLKGLASASFKRVFHA